MVTPTEVWKPIAGWEGKYEVSNTGFVRNAKSMHVLTPMRTGTNRPGSQRSKVRLSTNPRKDYEVGALVLETFLGPRPLGAQVLHANDEQ